MKKTLKKIFETVFLCYVAVLLYFLLFSERNGSGTNGYNVRLFGEIVRYIKYREILGSRLVIRNLLGNVVGFLPFGILLPMVNSNMKKIWKVTLGTAIFSLIIEITQLIAGVGCFDVDDIMLNTLGGCLGGLLWLCGMRMKDKYGKKEKKI